MTDAQKFIDKQLELLKQNDRLFDSYSYNQYIKKYSAEELKKHICIHIIAGKKFFEGMHLKYADRTYLVDEFKSDIFNIVKIFYCPYVEDTFQHIDFIDDRHKIDWSEAIKPYLPIINFINREPKKSA